MPTTETPPSTSVKREPEDLLPEASEGAANGHSHCQSSARERLVIQLAVWAVAGNAQQTPKRLAGKCSLVESWPVKAAAVRFDPGFERSLPLHSHQAVLSPGGFLSSNDGGLCHPGNSSAPFQFRRARCGSPKLEWIRPAKELKHPGRTRRARARLRYSALGIKTVTDSPRKAYAVNPADANTPRQ